MLPQPDEQVIVAFENGDPSYPVVLGSMFNGRDKPGAELARIRHDGSFALKSDHAALVRRQGGHHPALRQRQVGHQDRRRRDQET